jgi:Holliday junction resolvase RusA-like endonuclease
LKRHRDRKGGGKYDPSKSDKDIFVMHCNHHRPKEPFDFPLHVYLQFHFLNRKSLGDVDNLIKFVFDALNGIFWKDDRYIDRVTAVRVFKGNPRTEVIIMEVDHKINKS